MAIKHATIKAPLQPLAAVADWNADHTGTAPAESHGISDAAKHSADETPGKILKADANGLPTDATNTDAEVAVAVTHSTTIVYGIPINYKPTAMYLAGDEISTLATSVGSTGIDIITATPVVFTKSVNIDQLTFRLQNAVNIDVRIGIYADNGSVYPGALVVDAGETTTAGAGIYSKAVAVTLAPGLYWFVIHSSAAGNVDGPGASIQMVSLGVSGATLATKNSWYQGAQAYGALPGTFPAGATIKGAAAHCSIYYRIA